MFKINADETKERPYTKTYTQTDRQTDKSYTANGLLGLSCGLYVKP